ncbi:FlgK family flagellar hook-associated protein [Sandaracinobacteroides saxicola]|uniref:Flagellar hook-associated protein 1 n=1 Tax=Sandaracinobacteroides saxicola TaxID=2759707 RepID=A0A7G5IFW5_9SPHN|nr:flagellar basal body rod C-terminal domain-containing protein [Sandaracinobacteroides saxicola]QMW22257.1 hypothetical protein H3309_12955 [Sandaracinobacteroides saxicola]
MPLNQVLGAALSGLSAAQAGLRGIAGNIANAQSPGYARAEVRNEALVAGGRGLGVRASEAQRVADRFLDGADITARGEAARTATLNDWLGRAVAFYGSPGQGGGLEDAISAVQAAAVDLAGTALSQGREVFVGRLEESARTVRSTAQGLAQLRMQVDDETGRTVQRINDLLGRVGELNDGVAKALAFGQSVSGLADRRQQALMELGGLVGIRTREDSQGRIQVETLGGQLLIDRHARRIDPASDRFGTGSTVHPELVVRVVGPNGRATNASESLNTAGAGGRLGGLLRLRDIELPRLADGVGLLGDGLKQAVNAAAAEAITMPPMRRLEGAQTGMLASDPHGLTGRVSITVFDADGIVVARSEADSAAQPDMASLVATLNDGLGGHGTVQFVNGRLTLENGLADGGIVMAGGFTADGRTAALAMGINRLLDGPVFGSAVPLIAGAAHGAGPGETLFLAVRDTAGRLLGTAQSEPAADGPMIGDVIAALNRGELAGLGSFALDADGAIRFRQAGTDIALQIDLVADSTQRGATGVGLSDALLIGTGRAGAVAGALKLDPAVVADPTRLAIGSIDHKAAPGMRAVAPANQLATGAYTASLTTVLASDRFDRGSLDLLTGRMIAEGARLAAVAATTASDASARAAEVSARRENFSAVNVDEEMAAMVLLQNSYSASARVVSASRDMLDDLLRMVG